MVMLHIKLIQANRYNFYRLLITLANNLDPSADNFANNLDPDQAMQNFNPDIDWDIENTRWVSWYQVYQARLWECLLTSRGLPSDSTCVLKAEPGKLDIKRRESGILFISMLIKLVIMT